MPSRLRDILQQETPDIIGKILRVASKSPCIFSSAAINDSGKNLSCVILEGNAEPVKFKRLGLRDVFCSCYGTHQELKRCYGIAKEDIIREVKHLLK